MRNSILLGFILLMFLLYGVILPVLKKRQQCQTEQRVTAFQNSLKVRDQVLLAAGIIGEIKGITHELIALEISKGTTIEVDRLAVVGKLPNNQEKT